MDTKLRELVFNRSKGYCERCAIPIHLDNFALHHRKLKSRGGKDTADNLVALHHHCHNLGTDSVHLNPGEATRRGLMVASWDDPANIPVTLDDESQVILSPNGTYLTVGTEDGWGTANHNHGGPSW